MNFWGGAATLSLTLCLSCLVSAQTDYRQERRYVLTMVGQSYPILGAEDTRQAWGLAFGVERIQKQLRFRDIPGRLSLEAYFLDSSSKGEDVHPPNRSAMFGMVGIARWEGHSRAGLRGYLGVGWGLQVVDRELVDLSTPVNSTPILEIGGRYTTGRSDITLALRWLHASNAGLRGNNQGLNFIMLMASASF